jgi:hypothetical protein
LLTNPAEGARLAGAARRLASSVYDWLRIGALQVAIVERLATTA